MKSMDKKMQSADIKLAGQEKAGTRGGGRQAEKSQQTRTATLEATIQCLVEIGYNNTALERIAECAKVTRGAMMHHYDSRAEVIEKAAHYLAEKRLAEFEQLARTRIPAVKDGALSLVHMKKAVEVVRIYYSLPSYAALQELRLAARTDKDLSAVMRQVEKTIDSRMAPLIAKIFPVWRGMEATLAQLTDLVTFTQQGVAANHANQLEKKRLSALEEMLAHIAYEMYRKDGVKDAEQG